MFLGTARTSVKCFYENSVLIVSLRSGSGVGSGERVRTLFRHLHHKQFFAFFGFAYMRRNEWILF